MLQSQKTPRFLAPNGASSVSREPPVTRAGEVPMSSIRVRCGISRALLVLAFLAFQSLAGSGTDGTANFWIDNHCEKDVTVPLGLCDD